MDTQEYIQEENSVPSSQLQLNENFYYDNDADDNVNIDDFSNFGNTESEFDKQKEYDGNITSLEIRDHILQISLYFVVFMDYKASNR